MNLKKNRILWVDYAKAFLIFCVVLLHANIQEPVNSIINIYLIPYFIFLSGLFSNPRQHKSYFSFIKEKGSRILIPYFTFNIITYVFWLLLGRHFGLDEGSSISPLDPIIGIFYSTSTRLYHYVPLWFLGCLFSTESINYLVFKKIKSNKFYLLAMFILFFLGYINYTFNKTHMPWSIDIALVMIVFYAAGTLFRKSGLINRISNKQFFALLIMTSLVVYVILTLNTPVKAHNNIYGNYFLFFIGAFAGIIALTSLFKLLENYIKPMNFVVFIGKNTLIILALHLICGSFIKAITVYIFNYPLAVFDLQYMKVIYSILSVALLVPVIIIINKKLPFLLGKSK